MGVKGVFASEGGKRGVKTADGHFYPYKGTLPMGALDGNPCSIGEDMLDISEEERAAIIRQLGIKNGQIKPEAEKPAAAVETKQ